MSEKLLDQSYQQRQFTFLFRHQHWRVFICQCMGTAMFVMGVCCTLYKNPVSDKVPNTPMMHDLFVILFLYMARCFFAPFTGGHFNPAVTLGAFMNKNIKERITARKLLTYILGQFIGATIGAILSKTIYDASTGPFIPTTDYSSNDILVRFLGEMIGMCSCQQLRQPILINLQPLRSSFTWFSYSPLNKLPSYIRSVGCICLFLSFSMVPGSTLLYAQRRISKYVDGLNPFQLLSLQFVTSYCTPHGQQVHVLYVLILGLGQLIGAGLAGLFFNCVYYPSIVKWRNQQ